MKIIKTEKRFCECCMEEHDVQRVVIREHNVVRGTAIDYDAEYFYCAHADETYSDEEMLSANDIAMKDAYRKAMGLLTTDEIIRIRANYGISQSDLSRLLGWGGKTITRYEGHQVQDNAHDTILRKLDDDPEWFLVLLESAKKSFSLAAYMKYQKLGTQLFERGHDRYLRRAIYSRYARLMDNLEFNGNQRLSLDVVTDVICYFSNSLLVTGLYKVKLMKMLWYSDALSYKRRGHAITGMVYRALPMGAVPIAHDSIIDLQGIHCEEIEMGEGTAYKFLPTENTSYPSLLPGDVEILDAVIKRFGRASREDIVNAMHHENAYRETAPRGMISFRYAKELSLV